MSALLNPSFNRRAAFVAAALLLALGLFVGILSENALSAQKLRELDIQARTLAQSVAAPLMFADPSAARENANALAENPELEAVGVYDQTGRLIASFKRPNAQALPLQPTISPPHYGGADIEVGRSVEREGQRYGAVYMRLRRETWGSRLARYTPMALLLAMTALVVLLGGAAQNALRQAYDELARRAGDLTESNRRLSEEIESRKQAEEALVQSRKMEAIGQLTGGVAHDFNNLLMVISGGVRMLRRSDTPERREKTMAAMDQAVERGAGLTRQLLAFARREPITTEPVNIAQRLNGMRELLERSLRADILLDIAVPDNLPPVATDPGQFELAILNLCVNARDAMPKGGLIAITAHTSGDKVEIAVKDTGSGIEPKILDRIFEPYFTTKAAGQGTGLGLSQVYGFAQQSGGGLRIESQVGQGTTVYLALPATDAAVAAAEEPASAPDPTNGAMRILAVEDDDAVAATVTGMLSELGHSFRRAASAQDALEILNADRAFDLVFSDIIMPGGMNGVELAAEIRKRMPEMPVLLTTGYSGRDQVDASWPILRKPYQIEDLRGALYTEHQRQSPPQQRSAIS